MDILKPGNLNYWEQIFKNKEDIAMLKEISTHFTYAVGLKLSLRDMPFDVNNVTINKSAFHGYIINRVYQDGVTYTIQVKYNNKIYTTDMFVFFGTANGLYVLCFPETLENGVRESILYLGKWNETSKSYEYCNQITTDLSDAIQELTESLSNYQTKLTFDDAPTLGSNNPVTSDGIKQAIDVLNNNIGDLSSLETTAKDNLVNAINELKNSSGGCDLLWSGITDIISSQPRLSLSLENGLYGFLIEVSTANNNQVNASPQLIICYIKNQGDQSFACSLINYSTWYTHIMRLDISTSTTYVDIRIYNQASITDSGTLGTSKPSNVNLLGIYKIK